MDPDALAALACPHCMRELSLGDAVLECPHGHTFDIARQGYVSLLGARSRTDTADTASMVDARARFMDAGYYDGVAASASDILRGMLPPDVLGPIADVGAGTGWLLEQLLGSLPGRSGIAIDSSKHAARRSARAHPRIASVVADAWSRLPLADGSCSAVISFFAPRNVPEFRRVLHDRGTCLVITPTAEHLGEIREALRLVGIENEKDQRVGIAFREAFTCTVDESVVSTMRLGHAGVADLARMGPSAHHTTAQGIESAVAGLPETVDVTLSVRMRAFRPVSPR